MITYTIYHDEALENETGSVTDRVAVRAVINRRGQVLMIYSPVNGDYKFPGGGVEPGESYPEAVIREVREESGFDVQAVGGELARMIEVMRDNEGITDIFRMTSRYYACSLSPDSVGEQNLDGYEADLGFTPVWISMDEAIAKNKVVIQSGRYPRWTPRDTYVLEKLLCLD